MLPKRIADTSKISPQIPIIHRANTILQLAQLSDFLLLLGLWSLWATLLRCPQIHGLSLHNEHTAGTNYSLPTRVNQSACQNDGQRQLSLRSAASSHLD
jgi:hypothetical protein